MCHRLGVSHVIKEPKGRLKACTETTRCSLNEVNILNIFKTCPFTEETVATGEVINQLLHHVGAMCIHQLNLLAASSNSLPLGALLGKQHPIEARHFSSICDIMEKAMVNGDTCIIRCILVVFQVGLSCSWGQFCTE